MEPNSSLISQLRKVVASFASAKIPAKDQAEWEQKLAGEPDFKALEEAVQKFLGLSGREALEAEVQQRALKVDAEWAARPQPLKCAACGRTLSRHEVQPRRLASTIGALNFNRQIYRCEKCGTLAPADLALGLKPRQRETPWLKFLQSEFGATAGSFMAGNALLRLPLSIRPVVATTEAVTVCAGNEQRAWEDRSAKLARRDSRAVPLVPHPAGEGGVDEDLIVGIDGGMAPCLRNAATVAKAAAEAAAQAIDNAPDATVSTADAAPSARQAAAQRTRRRPKTQNREVKPRRYTVNAMSQPSPVATPTTRAARGLRDR